MNVTHDPRASWTAWGALMALLAAAPAGAEAQPLLRDPAQAVLQAQTEDGRREPMPLVAERLLVVVDAQHAWTTLEQTYRNQTGAVVTGRYLLVVGQDAHVDGFAYWNGEERIVGEVFERETARAIYNEVTARRRDPGLLEQIGEGAFTFRVFPIQPEENKRVEVTWTRWLPRRGRSVEYRAPASTGAAVEMELRDPRGIRDLRSPSHRLEIEQPSADRVVVRAARLPRSESSELVLRWAVADEPWAVDAHVHRDAGHDGYFHVTLAAPEEMRDAVAAKDVTLLLDRSGSMAGAPLEQTRLAAQNVLRRLGPEDRVNVLLFDDDVDRLFTAPREVTDDVRRQALDFVAAMSDGGGTNIAYALDRALGAQRDDARPKVVLLLTDGQSDASQALEVAREDRRDVRVFTVGLGDGVDRPLLARLAAQKRGRFTFIESAEALETRVGELYRQIAEPVLVDVTLEVEGAVATRVYPRTLSDLFVDDELRLSGRFRGDGPIRFVVRGNLRGRAVAYTATARPAIAPRRPWVGRLWAKARVADLLEEIALAGESEELKREVLELALAYNFTTPYTAFLAVPESELTERAAQDLAWGRAQRAEAQQRNADAVALQAARPDDDGEDPRWAAAPGSVDPEPAFEEVQAMPGDSPDLAMDASRAGCASCASAGRAEGLELAFPLGVLAILGWRRRRA